MSNFVVSDGRISGTLKTGMEIQGVIQKDFVLREATVGDYLDTENDAGTDKPLNFNTHLLARQLVQIGDFKGPFTVGMIRNRLNKNDWVILRAAQSEINTLGEDTLFAERIT